jgi:hypothetical protein
MTRYGAAYVGSTNKSASLYDTSATDLMGTSKGLRQYYRWGLYSESSTALGSGPACVPCSTLQTRWTLFRRGTASWSQTQQE